MSPFPTFATPKLPAIPKPPLTPPISSAPVLPAPPAVHPPAISTTAPLPALKSPNMQATLAQQQHVAKCSEITKAQADAWQKDDALARAKGNSPDQLAARKRAALLFCQLHLPDDAPAAREARIAAIDYSQPLSTINARGKDLSAPKSGRFLNMGRKPSYLVSTRFLPKTDEDPIYALEYFSPKA